jgi:branched-subunit amino acid permease
MGITFAFSLLGFSNIMIILNAILEIAYPALIGLAVMNILAKLTSIDQPHGVFWGTLAVTLVLKLWG